MAQPLMSIHYEGKVVAFIDQEGQFVCLDKEKMLRTLRFQVVRLQNLAALLPPPSERS
jgi:hypothetical protein